MEIKSIEAHTLTHADICHKADTQLVLKQSRKVYVKIPTSIRIYSLLICLMSHYLVAR